MRHRARPFYYRPRIEERLRHLERHVAEVRTRINGLFFLVLGATLLQFLARVSG